jgi:hypothetical protein
MRIINDGLPEIIYEYLSKDFYDGDKVADSISATTLLKPTQEIMLLRRHKEEITVNASDRIWSLFGSSVHAVLEGGFQGKYEQEERLFRKVKIGRKEYTISGKFDLIKDNVIHDFKVTSAFTLMFNSRVDEWKEQLSTYRWLKFPRILAKTGKIIAILRDWTAKNLSKENYPKSPIVEIEIDLMDYKDVDKMVEKKLKEIARYETSKDEELPECTKAERWFNQKKDEYIKCSKYCSARQFCQQLKRSDK